MVGNVRENKQSKCVEDREKMKVEDELFGIDEGRVWGCSDARLCSLHMFGSSGMLI